MLLFARNDIRVKAMLPHVISNPFRGEKSLRRFDVGCGSLEKKGSREDRNTDFSLRSK